MNTFDPSLRKKRLMTLAHLFLLHRYKAGLVHYLSPTEDNQHQALKMQRLGIFGNVNTEAGLIIVASINSGRIGELLNPDLLAAIKPQFLRFPGGNYLEGNTFDTRFNWKNTIGPIEERPGHMDDAWGYWSSD